VSSPRSSSAQICGRCELSLIAFASCPSEPLACSRRCCVPLCVCARVLPPSASFVALDVNAVLLDLTHPELISILHARSGVHSVQGARGQERAHVQLQVRFFQRSGTRLLRVLPHNAGFVSFALTVLPALLCVLVSIWRSHASRLNADGLNADGLTSRCSLLTLVVVVLCRAARTRSSLISACTGARTVRLALL
jgi:hypothetical protein